ncbi:MAG: SUMF1/EgtB/PvdO family nonheme iron enzyme [Sodalinema sp.]|uniref:SUMF1/EgtB/PvdO family nonheme iron enzyme n=1 Tax=Sodalinema sp. TaxID=3080550 RepID=UPI00396F3811
MSVPSEFSPIHVLRQALIDCRQATLNQVQNLGDRIYYQQAHPDFSPIGWHLGHIGFTEELWLLRHCAGQAPHQPQTHRLYAADGLPKQQREQLPSLTDTCEALQQVRQRVLDYLPRAPLSQQARLWWFILQHESQHSETMAIVEALHRRKYHHKPLYVAHPTASSAPDFKSIKIPAGTFLQGNSDANAIDNEQPAFLQHLDRYQIDRYPVTCGQYRRFIEAGGYNNPDYWSAAGWQFIRQQNIQEPLYWPQQLSQLSQTEASHFDHYPVCGVSWYEANAYANFVGKRLPSEAEWEKAASWNPQQHCRQPYPWGTEPPQSHHCNHHRRLGGMTPVHAYPDHCSPWGVADMLGNVWEWTSTPFAGYSGFRSFPYTGYSQTYFDGHHYVLRGGSWTTRPWTLRNSFRNWYFPQVRELFAGFRLCERE